MGLIYTQRKPILEKGPFELPCGKESTYFKVTQQGQRVILREATQEWVGWPCPVSEAPLPSSAAPCGGHGPSVHCEDGAIPKLGFLQPQFRDAAKKQSGDNFW